MLTRRYLGRELVIFAMQCELYSFIWKSNIGMIHHLLGLFSKDLGIDLGTANTVVCAKGEGIIISEPSVVAVWQGTNQVWLDGEAVGERAKQMLGRTPNSVEAIRPLKNGVIADFDVTESMLEFFIRKSHGTRRLFPIRSRVVVAVPSGITAVEKRAVVDSAIRAGARDVRLIKEPMAAAIGAGLPINEPKGSMIVDIGGGTSEIAIISLRDIVESTSLRVAGDEINDALIQYVKTKYNLQIGEPTAERIKIEIGSAYPLDEELVREVRGRDTIDGMPRSITITSEEIREALYGPLEAIIRAIRGVLERTQPELHNDLVETGITLAGGGALLRGFDRLIARETGLPVRRADDPLNSVARGTGMVLDQMDSFWNLLEVGLDVA